MQSKHFTTKNRKLEGFLYAHLIRPLEWRKEDGWTVWEYEETEELLRVVREYMDMMTRHNLGNHIEEVMGKYA